MTRAVESAGDFADALLSPQQYPPSHSALVRQIKQRDEAIRAAERAPLEEDRDRYKHLFETACTTIRSQRYELDAAEARAQRADAVVVDEIIRDICELSPDDPDHPDSVCVSWKAIEVILRNHILHEDDALDAAASPATKTGR